MNHTSSHVKIDIREDLKAGTPFYSLAPVQKSANPFSSFLNHCHPTVTKIWSLC